MNSHEHIRVLIADDDTQVLRAYLDAFSETETTQQMKALDALTAELFEAPAAAVKDPNFDIVACSQGDEAISLARQAAIEGRPFDVVILDIRMPPGIDGVEAGRQIRRLDPDVEIIFVSGYSDLPLEELWRRVPPPMKLHYFNKPLSFSALAREVASMVGEH
jgi:CheY-like chemotaxis protein